MIVYYVSFASLFTAIPFVTGIVNKVIQSLECWGCCLLPGFAVNCTCAAVSKEIAGNSFTWEGNMATLFSYFTKSPKSTKPSSPICGDTAEKKKNKSPKEGAKGFSPIGQEKANQPDGNSRRASLQKSNPTSDGSDTVRIAMCEIVWAKLEGHPWWPSLICNHPTQGVYLRGKRCHVQFFGEPPSRAWVDKR